MTGHACCYNTALVQYLLECSTQEQTANKRLAGQTKHNQQHQPYSQMQLIQTSTAQQHLLLPSTSSNYSTSTCTIHQRCEPTAVPANQQHTLLLRLILCKLVIYSRPCPPTPSTCCCCCCCFRSIQVVISVTGCSLKLVLFAAAAAAACFCLLF